MGMLAHQGWRLIQERDSLCGRVLRAKYFPDGNILGGTVKPGISYTWRSILRGVALLKEGLVWRVGDGSKIKVWEDPWLPEGDTRRPRAVRGSSVVEAVADRINPTTGAWDETMIQGIFPPEDVKTILSISICDDMEDNLAWHFDPKGIFSVKSAYKVGVMLRDRSCGSDAACSRVSTGKCQVNFDWNHIWKMRVPNKLKMFVWRLAHNSLALRMKIARIGIELDTSCPVCHRKNEDGGHIFLKCKHAKECWGRLGLGETREKLLPCSSAHHMFAELWKCDENIQLKATIFMWEWWNVRNKANAGEVVPNAQTICHGVESLGVDFLMLRVPDKPPKPPDLSRWVKPPENFVKVNFDGAFSQISGSGGWGYVIHDQAGVFVAAGAGNSVHLRSPLHSEAVACLAAIDGAIRVGANKIIFESDASVLVQALNSYDYDKSTIGVLVKEARSLSILNFVSFNFSFGRRACNVVAHELARFGVSCENADSFWEGDAPPCILNIIASDLAEV